METTSFCAEEKVIEMYKKRCEEPMKSGTKQGLITGLGFGFSFFVLYSVYATCFYAGARFVKAGKANYGDVFQVFLALTMTTTGISGASSFAPDSSKAKSAAASIFKIIDRKSKIDSRDESGMVLENVKGDIELCHITFTYQTRPDIHIFRDLYLTIRAGKTVALVGESGSGKSTVISLLQRFLRYHAHAVKGVGKTHAKWSPVGTAWYRMLPEVVIVKEVEGQLADELKKACRAKVFDIEDMGKGRRRAIVARPRKCTLCRECIGERFGEPKTIVIEDGKEKKEWIDRVEVRRVRNHFIFKIESTGSLPPDVLFTEAVKILEDKCETVISEFS